MRDYYKDIYEIIINGFTLTLVETNISGKDILGYYVIHDGETDLRADEKEADYFRAWLPTICFINVNDTANYPSEKITKSFIKFFRISNHGVCSELVPFNKYTFIEDLWNTFKKI